MAALVFLALAFGTMCITTVLMNSITSHRCLFFCALLLRCICLISLRLCCLSLY
ncbi:hypothetical protein C8R45DRAFT_1016137 [Mycena sanguinolenta]|nr:hypothetical protein C8R45DRAFT_1016137 [Mycena sanguinolenta]